MQSQGKMPAATIATKPFHKSGRRTRIPLSCDPCRKRKLKCNRKTPCQNCTVRVEQASCKYKGSKNEPRSSALLYDGQESADDMQQRIDHLENLVKMLTVQNQELSQSHPPNYEFRNHNGLGSTTKSNVLAGTKDALNIPHSTGTTVISRGQSVYKSANDWSDLLQEVNELKKTWNQTDDNWTGYSLQNTLANAFDGSSFLTGHVKQVEMPELLATLPPKPELDKLIHQFFDRKTFAIPVAPILHEPTFMSEYAEHWRDPSRTNVIWLGLLFSILSIIMLSYHQFSNEPPEYKGTADAMFELYRLRTAQCLVIGDIVKCLPGTIETLLLNSSAELSRKDDSGRGLWMMTGVMVRAAINMGYHREPSQTSSISILQGELRRRIWLALVGKDHLASFLVGFPSMMLAINSDTLEPRNLHDWELSNDTTVLPPSRPLAESTPVTYLIVKGRLMRALGRVADFNNALMPCSYTELLEIDSSLQEAFENIPPHMKTFDDTADSDFSLSESAKSASLLQMQFLYHLGMCALHRKFLAKGRVDKQFAVSRDRCILSALALLDQQHAFHQNSLSKSLSSMSNWYEISHARQVFILAAMIICLVLEHRRRGTNTDMTPDSSELLRALKGTCAIWKDVRTSSDEAWRVYKVLVSMLLSFDTTAESSSSQVRVPEPEFEMPEIDKPSSITNNIFLTEDDFEGPNEMEIDWALWDSFIEGASFEDVYEGMSFNDVDL